MFNVLLRRWCVPHSLSPSSGQRELWRWIVSCEWKWKHCPSYCELVINLYLNLNVRIRIWVTVWWDTQWDFLLLVYFLLSDNGTVRFYVHLIQLTRVMNVSSLSLDSFFELLASITHFPSSLSNTSCLFYCLFPIQEFLVWNGRWVFFSHSGTPNLPVDIFLDID